MSKFRPRRPSPALVVSCLALFVAMGGTSYAALNLPLPARSVGTRQLKRGAVSTAKIKDGAVTAVKINPAGLSVPFATSATNAANAANATNATTATSANALNGAQLVAGPSEANNFGDQNSETVVCPTGMVAVGGGLVNNGGIEESINETSIESSPGGTNNEFVGFVNNNGTTAADDDTFHVWALCIHGSVGGSDAVRSAAVK